MKLKASDIIGLALGLGVEDMKGLDDWAKAWGVDFTERIVADAIRETGSLDEVGNWLYAEIVRRSADVVAGAILSGWDEDGDLMRDFAHALRIWPNLGSTDVFFGGDRCFRIEDLFDAVRKWKRNRDAAA